MWGIDFKFSRHSDHINGVSVSNDGSYVATASSDCSVGIYSVENPGFSQICSHKKPVLACKFAPSENIFASASMDGNVNFHNAEQKQTVASIRCHSMAVSSLDWSHDGNSVVTGSHDSTIAVWDVKRESRTANFADFSGWVRDTKWHNDMIASAGCGRFIFVYDIRSGKTIHKIPTGTVSDISSISFHHDGFCLGCGSFDEKVRIFDLRNYSLFRKQRSHCEPVTSFAFSPTSDDFLTTSSDGFARIWSLKVPDVIHSFRYKGSSFLCSSFFSDGCRFITAGRDRNVVCFSEKENEEIDGGELVYAVNRMQGELENLSNTMKALDRRLLMEEEKVQWIKDNSSAIENAVSRRKGPSESSSECL